MKSEYIKEDRVIRITGIGTYLDDGPLTSNLYLFINDVQVADIVDLVSYDYPVTSDGIYKISIASYDYEILNEIIEVGYELVVDYSKDKNRSLMLAILDNTVFYGLSSLWVKNNKLIREIEFSFYSGNIKRCTQLLAEIKWN